MGRSPRRNFLCATICVAVLTACGGGSGSGVPNDASSSATVQNSSDQEGSRIKWSGQYGGLFHNEMHVTSKVKLILSQTQSSLGGVIVDDNGSGGIAAVVAWVASGNTISGTGIGPAGSVGYCTYSMSGTYKNRKLRGTYTATYGCSGQSGTFILRHKCYFEGTGSDAIGTVRPAKPC